MSKRKWYTKAIYLGVALAMTLGLVVMPVGAQHDPEIEICSSLNVTGNATAVWVNTPVGLTHSENVTVLGDYSARLSDGGAGATSFSQLILPGLNIPLPGITELSFYFHSTNPLNPDYIPALSLHIDTDGDGARDFVACVTMTAGDIQYGAQFTQGAWGMWDLSTPVVTKVGTGPIWHGTAGPDKTFAEVKAAAAALVTSPATEAVVLYVMIGEGAWGGSQTWTPSTTYVDDITIEGVTYDVEPCYTILPDIAKDVKGSEQRFEVWDWAWNATASEADLSFDWTVTPKLGLTTDEVTIRDGGDDYNYVVIRSLEPGDASVECVVSGAEAVPAEKKWGLIHHTILDLDTDTIGAQTDVSDEAGTAGNATAENVTDTVYAQFYQEPFPATFIDEAGHAVVHWWLIVDDAAGENETAIDDIMAALGECPEEGTEPCGCGTYADWPVDETATDWQAEDNPFDAIETVYAASAAANTTFSAVIEGIVAADNDPNLDGTFNVPLGTSYIKTMTEDDMAGQTRGLTGVTLSNIGAEDILIVTLVEYPWNYFGENPVCIEKGTKTWYPPGVPPIPEQIKAPQVRWAGEKIVLEKEWGVEGKIVVFALQGNSVGSLEAIYTDDIAASDAETVITTVQEDGVARCILQSQPQGQADVKAALYTSTRQPGGGSFSEVMGTLNTVTPPQNHDFLVYFLALEDVNVDEELSVLTAIDAGASANVTVQVKGWFTSDALPGTLRDAVVSGDGITLLRPAGRYILPDDWAALAGSDLATSNKASRPQYDLMNTPGAGVDSSVELGPYDSGVRTTTIPGEAETPCIGPFNALQPWSNFDAVTLDPVNRWIATDSVDSSILPDNLRNTVVPDTTIDWYDCPMPQALVTFNVTDTGVLVLAALDKGTVLDYGIDSAGKFIAPFYKMEIPSHWLIPVAGYFWDSWGTDGPYDFWDDLGVTPTAANILEVYSDNHGYAGVTIVGTGLDDECVTLDVIADFPVMAAKYPAVDTDTGVCWGEEVMHLDADFEVSDRTGEAPITISFYGLKAEGTGAPWTEHGTPPYVKAEWDFDGDGFIDETVIGTGTTDDEITDSTLATQTFEFTTANGYSPWLRVTDDDGLVDICQKPNYIVLTGPPSVPLCDIDDSGTVDIEDFVVFAGSYGLSLGDVDYDERCDLNETNGVDILDFIIFAQCYVAEA